MEESKEDNHSLKELFYKINKTDTPISKHQILKKIDSSMHFKTLIIILGFKFLEENKRFITTSEIMAIMNLPRSYIYELLTFLVNAKILQKIHSPGIKDKRYILVQDKILKECADVIHKRDSKEK